MLLDGSQRKQPVRWRLNQIGTECLGDFEVAAGDKGIACWNSATQEQFLRCGRSILFLLRKQTESISAAPGLKADSKAMGPMGGGPTLTW